jgi:predicted transcriptional regulator
MTSGQALLLSLRPRFASAILAGTKTIEVRRRPVNASTGTPIILYASSPLRAVVGTACLAGVHNSDHATAWRRHRGALGLARWEFDTYLEGTTQVYLLHLQSVSSLDKPMPLRHLREDGPFRPPQSFRYVAETDPSRLRDLVDLVTKHR